MKEEISKLFICSGRFKKLNVNGMLPDVPRIEIHILKGIEKCIARSDGEKIKVSSVVEATQMPAPAVSRALKCLEEKDLIARTVCSKDRRNTYVEITQKGQEILEDVNNTMMEFGNAVFERLGEESIQALTDALEKLLTIAEEEVDKRVRVKSKGKEGENN